MKNELDKELRDLDHATRWFGESWDAPVNHPDTKVNVPVGQVCIDCHVPIEEWDQGFMLFTVDHETRSTRWEPWHRACFVSVVVPPEILQSATTVKRARKL